MSLPSNDAASAKDTSLSGFYGRSYPRATVLLDADNKIRDDRELPPPSANAPLIDWARKADWKMGGAKETADEPVAPKPAFTPIYAFLARKQLKIKTMHPFLSSSDAAVLAKVDAAEAWGSLSAEEQDVYAKLAEEDAVRYEKEAAAFEEQYPGLLAKKSQRKPERKATKPRQPLTAFRAYLLVQLRNDGGADPKDCKKSAAFNWKQMTEIDQAPYHELAEEDQQRWNKELDEFPDYKAKIEKRRDERIRKQQEHAAKSSIFHAAKKRPTRPGKMALPKRKRAAKTRRTAKKIVQASKTSEPKPRASRKTRSQKVREEVFNEEESDTEPEEEPNYSASDSDNDVSEADLMEDDEEDVVSADEGAEGSEDEDEAEDAGAADVMEDMDVEISETEGEQEPTATNRLQALAEEAALDESGGEEDDEDNLRTAKTPADLLMENSTKDGLFGWAKSALISGIKGVWGGKQKDTPGNGKKAEQAQVSATQAPLEEARGEALVGKAFTKFFNGKPYAGKVVRYLPQDKWYYVEYEDDDNEELVEAELLYLLSKPRDRKGGGEGDGAKKRKR